MKKIDIIFSIICGLSVAWIGIDFLGIFGLILLIVFPLLSLIGLYATEIIGKKLLFIHQAGKFGLAGAFADVIDIKVFQLLFLLAPFPLFLKGISFLVATFVKFWWNKHWAFERREKDGVKKEVMQFFLITLGGLALNIVSFYYFTKIAGPQFSMSVGTWTELCIIFAALIAATWNFLGYKFLVFKK